MRFSLKFTGESGQGINSLGEIIAVALKNSGFHTFGYREYPSLIKGGYASYQITFSDQPHSSTDQSCDLMVSISRESLHQYLSTVKNGGYIIHSVNKLLLSREEKQYIADKQLTLIYVNSTEETLLLGGSKLMSNVFLLGVVWKQLGLDYSTIEDSVVKKFGKRPELLDANKKILTAGFTHQLEMKGYGLKSNGIDTKDDAILTGNDAIALGAYAAGCRAYYAYPMTPASSVLSTLASIYHDTKMLVKQAEDEITAVQMTLGSMYMGTRAMTGTSGGGFDLMTESLSFAGIAELPLVVLLAQRPGPATGLPTWTAQGDLNLAIHAGHGELPRVVLSVSDPESAYEITQTAFDLAEKYQLPVIILTDKHIAESLYQIDNLPEPIEVNQYLSEGKEDEHRYNFSETGVSPRWLPGTSKKMYITNSDEHDIDGNTTEDANISKAMQDKRMKKLQYVLQDLPDPEIYGDEDPDLSIVGWGSSKSVMVDLINNSPLRNRIKVSYMHLEYLYPLKTPPVEEFLKNAKTSLLIENNSTAQLGRLIRESTGLQFDKQLLKYDGRPFFYDEVLNYINSLKIS